MRQAERLIALRALLARVQTNAKERRAELAALGLGPDAPRPERVASDPPIAPMPPRHRARERVPTPRGHFDDDWSSLLTRDLNDPSPERRAASLEPAEAPQPPALPFSRVASFAPPPIPADLAPIPPVVHGPSSQRDDDDKHPDSEIVRAIRLAAEHPHPTVDHREIWTGAGPELRERKPATNPPLPPRPEDLEPEEDDDGPVLDLVRLTPTPSRISSRPPPPPIEAAADAPVVWSDPPPASAQPRSAPPPLPPRPPAPVAPSPDPEVEEVAQEVTLTPIPSYLGGRRSRRIERVVSPRKQSSRRFLAALVVAAPLAGLAAWSFFDQPRNGREAVASTPSVASAVKPPPSPSASSATLPPETSRPVTPPGIPVETGSAPQPATPETAIPSAPPPRNPRESGMLWVDTTPRSTIYVQSLEAGESGRWLEVPCGMKFVRLARPGLPPPGHSFPMWLGVGQTVLIPCGESRRIALRPD